MNYFPAETQSWKKDNFIDGNRFREDPEFVLGNFEVESAQDQNLDQIKGIVIYPTSS